MYMYSTLIDYVFSLREIVLQETMKKLKSQKDDWLFEIHNYWDLISANHPLIDNNLTLINKIHPSLI